MVLNLSNIVKPRRKEDGGNEIEEGQLVKFSISPERSQPENSKQMSRLHRTHLMAGNDIEFGAKFWMQNSPGNDYLMTVLHKFKMSKKFLQKLSSSDFD